VEPESHRIHSNVHSETAHQQQQQQNQMAQHPDDIIEDVANNTTTTRENIERRHHSKVHKQENIEQQTDRQDGQMQRKGRQDYRRNGH